MKIWTITTDDNGTETAVHHTEAAANAQAVEIITAWWDQHVAADQEPRDHTDWRESYSILCDTVGFMASITFTEHDISHHPAIAAAIAAYDQMQNSIQDGQDMACNDETALAMDTCRDSLLTALGVNDPSIIVLSPSLDSEQAEQESAYRATAQRLHHKEGEIEIDDAAPVSMGDDPGAYVQAWVWVSAFEATLGAWADSQSREE